MSYLGSGAIGQQLIVTARAWPFPTDPEVDGTDAGRGYSLVPAAQ